MSRLTAADVKELMSHLSYKPNFDFRVMDDPGDLGIEITMYQLDAYQICAPATELTGRAMFDGVRAENGKIIEADAVRWPVPDTVLKGGEEAFWRWLHDDFISWLEHHEIDEWFRIDGESLNVAHDMKLPRLLAEWYANWSSPETPATASAKVASIALIRMRIEGVVDHVRNTMHDHGVPWEAIDIVPGLEASSRRVVDAWGRRTG